MNNEDNRVIAYRGKPEIYCPTCGKIINPDLPVTGHHCPWCHSTIDLLSIRLVDGNYIGKLKSRYLKQARTRMKPCVCGRNAKLTVIYGGKRTKVNIACNHCDINITTETSDRDEAEPMAVMYWNELIEKLLRIKE